MQYFMSTYTRFRFNCINEGQNNKMNITPDSNVTLKLFLAVNFYHKFSNMLRIIN